MIVCSHDIKVNVYVYICDIKLTFISRHFIYKKGRVNSNSRIISTDENPSLLIESSALIILRGVSTKLNKNNIYYSLLKN